MKLEINVPTKLSEINLGQYQRFLEIKDEGDGADFVNHKLIQIFCGADLAMVSKMRQRDIIEIVNDVNKLFKSHPSLINEFELNGKKFGFIPNLDNMSAGEYMDLDRYIVEPQLLHRAMSVLYRPIVRKYGDLYQIEEYDGTDKWCEAMKEMPVDVAISAMVFFYHLGNELLKSTTVYLAEAIRGNSIQTRNSADNGDGISQFTRLQKETYYDLMTLPNYQLINA
jgi:hypothetical protein